jgi:predicted O-linked N-acetylglucosamine transferase (SPINDLY family)
MFARIARGIRSTLAAGEPERPTVVERAVVPDASAHPSPSAEELISEGLRQRRQFGPAAAIPWFERAAQLDPNSHMPLLMLGNAASEASDLDRAVGYYQAARDLKPKDYLVRYNLGLNQLWRGYVHEAIEELAGASYLNPSYLAAHSSLIFALHNSDRTSPEEIVAVIREWAANFSAQHPATAIAAADTAVDRKLRVGFISGDFRTHSVAQFFEPIASARNRDSFEYIFYSNGSQRDAVTERLRECADVWHDVGQLTDNALIELIRADRVDILADLSGHTEFNRLAVFAQRAAPVQVTYLGFPNSTGLPTMDFRITDALTDPHPVADTWHTERLLRLPDSQWCFRPFGAPPLPGSLPARAAGYVTFGSFNNMMKVSDAILRCWAEILVKLPKSRLFLTRVRSRERAAEIVATMERSGIAADRIEWSPYRSEVPYGLQFAGIDIMLDTYPYNGVTTTCESLYVGVPVISLHGRHCVSRSGLSILTTLGLGELVAATPEQYVEIAVALASDVARLEQLRRELRDRFERSPLRDERTFAKNFEDLLQTAWRRHHASRPSE